MLAGARGVSLPACLPPHLGRFLRVQGRRWIAGGVAQGVEAGTSLQEEQQPRVFAAGSTKDGAAAVAACPVGAAVKEAAGQAAGLQPFRRARRTPGQLSNDDFQGLGTDERF